jgi:DNA-binding transcriptional ArsR family regulator
VDLIYCGVRLVLISTIKKTMMKIKLDNTEIDFSLFKEARNLFRFMNNKNINEILKVLGRFDQGLTVSALVILVKKDQAFISQRLSKLLEYGFVSFTKDGSKHVYKLNYDAVNDFHGFSDELGETIKEGENVFRTYCIDLRIEILFLLRGLPSSGCDVQTIVNELLSSRGELNEHLRILKEGNAVVTHREGKRIIYRINEKYVKKLFAITNDYFASITKK